jgi:hypothetical protein
MRERVCERTIRITPEAAAAVSYRTRARSVVLLARRAGGAREARRRSRPPPSQVVSDLRELRFNP